ncbi:hypothetical protein [Bacillus marinisedimentorum]|uniref:hypothetical protein n=1 Tax=Bacillus marinisedimentorum TaxID=1821260 RepID=UPI000872F0E6|nr:hypothetical protein [Bacillus marinisedimentorum]
MNIESLLTFIFDNFFLFLIIGGIYSFLKRLGEEGNKQERPPVQRQRENREPRPDSPYFEPETGEAEPDNRQRDRAPAEQTYQTAQNNLHQQYKDLVSQKEINDSGRVRKPAKPGLPKKQAIRSHPGHINKERAAEGVVWAEILSPPRSKRPINPRMKR